MTTPFFSLDEQQIKTLSQIAGRINESEDILSILDPVLAEVIGLAGLQSGWILLRKNHANKPGLDSSFSLAAQHNLPPDINADTWRGSCACQELCECGQLGEANHLVTCDRFTQAGAAWPELQNHVSIPLCSSETLYGLLNATTPKGGPVKPGSVHILILVAAHLSTALGRQRLAELELERHDQEQAALLMLTSQLLSLSKLEDVVNHLITEVIRLFQADACALLLPDEDGNNLVIHASAGRPSDPTVSRRRIPGSEHSNAGRVMREQVAAVSKSKADRADIPELTIEWLDAAEFEGMATVPLVVDGQSIGALTVTTRTPREFSREEIRFLKILADQAGIAIVNTRLRKEGFQLKHLEEELAIGRRIQRSLLPAASPQVSGWQFSDIYLPAKQVGGDLYDYFDLPYRKQLLGIVIGDVADKGVPAALFMATSRTLIRSAALADLTAASTLIEANRLIQQDSSSELFLSAFYGILDTGNGKLRYANAGHNPPLLFHQETGEIEELNAKGVLLCVLDEISLEELSVEVARDDVLVFYTDGVVEATNATYEEFGVTRLQQVVAANMHESADHIVKAVVEAVGDFCGCVEHADDITLVVAKRL